MTELEKLQAQVAELQAKEDQETADAMKVTDAPKEAGFLSVNYKEFHPETYKGVVASLGSESKTFSADGFEQDIASATSWLESQGAPSISKSSSVDNFREDLKKPNYAHMKGTQESLIPATDSPTISVINESTVLSDDQVKAFMGALQTQVSRDAGPIWEFEAILVFVPKGETPDPASWWLVILDDSDQAGALGYHELTSEALPIGKVFAKTDLQYGLETSVTASHELLEMLGDPDINLTVINAAGTKLYMRELCDAPEDDSLAYEIDGVKVSDFVLPAWFEDGNTKGPFSFKGNLSGPFQLAKGGYIGEMDVSSQDGWQQVTAEKAPRMEKSVAAKQRHSRRERRSLPREEWRNSESRPSLPPEPSAPVPFSDTGLRELFEKAPTSERTAVEAAPPQTWEEVKTYIVALIRSHIGTHDPLAHARAVQEIKDQLNAAHVARRFGQ